MSRSVSKPVYDYTGIISSSLCMVHCFFMPLLLVWLGSQGESVWLEMLEYGFLVLSLYAVGHAAVHTTLRPLKVLLPVFFLFLAGSVLAEDVWPYAQPLSYIASFGLISLHAFNLRYCRH